MRRIYQEDYHKVMEKEYQKNQKLIWTGYLFLAISALLYLVFFRILTDLSVFGAALCCDAAALLYIFRALKAMHPYWEMGLALKAAEKPDHHKVSRLIAGLEVAGKRELPAFHGRALEIFAETTEKLLASPEVPAGDQAELRVVMGAICGEQFR